MSVRVVYTHEVSFESYEDAVERRELEAAREAEAARAAAAASLVGTMKGWQ